MMFVLNQLGCDGLTFINLLGICLDLLLIMCSVTLLVYSLVSASYLAIQRQIRCLFFVLLAFLSTLFYLC